MSSRAARHRYYAYERRDGSVCYLPKLLHEGIQRYPRTIAHYHLVQWLGVQVAQQRRIQTVGMAGREPSDGQAS